MSPNSMMSQETIMRYRLLRLLFTILFFVVLAKVGVSQVMAQAVDSFAFSNFTGGGTKVAGLPFFITITARDSSNNVVTSFNDSVSLTDVSGTLYPTQTTDFTSGVWNGYVYITESGSTQITASYSGGSIQDTSTSFSVQPDSRIKFLTVITGNNQSGTAYTQLTNALGLKVVDPYNNPIPNIPVLFAINSYPPNSTGQSLSNSSATSDASGSASTLLTLGRKSGTYVVRANLGSGISSAVDFYATARPASLTSIKVTPEVAVMPAGSYLSFSATGYDQYLNEKTLASKTWSVVNSGGTIDSAGVFRAGATIGTYLNTVRVNSSGLGGTATVTVIEEQVQSPDSQQDNDSGSGSGTDSGSESTFSGSTNDDDTDTTETEEEEVLSTVLVDPGVITALQGAQIPIVAEAFSETGASVANVNFTFEVSGNLGTLTQTSANTVLLTASEVGVGTVTVTAQQGNIVRVARVVGSVGTGLNRRLVIEDIESPQQVGQPFTISIAAKDSLNNFITDYDGPIVLADTTGTIDPAVVPANDEGVWFVQAIVNLGHSDVSVTAAGDGMIGVSNAFEVLGEPRLSDIPPGGGGNGGAGGGNGQGAGDVLGASISGKIKELLQDKDLNKFTIARFIGAGLAAGIGILGASLGGGIMASRGLEALGRNPFARGKLKFNLYLGIISFIVAAGLAVFASFLIIQ